MIRIITFAFFLLISFFAKAQTITVKGIVRDTADKTMLTGATVQFRIAEDSLKKFSVATDRKGAFVLENLIPGNYILTITSVGYEPVKRNIELNADKDFGTIAIAKEADLLSEVTVKVSVPPVKQKGDTLEYGAAAFKVNPDATGEDLIKKMPGVTVDKAGTVTAQGEQVRKVTVDGREFFGDDATAALRNLPAEVIDKIQVFDRLSDQAQFTGVDDGNTSKSINIVTKAGMRNGQFGRVYAGYGTDDRYAAGGNVSFFKGDRRISLVGILNNINQQNFSSQDLLGVTSSSGNSGNRGNRGGGNRGGGAQGGNRGGGGGGQGNFGGGQSNFLVGQQNGISKTNSFGINYSDLWGKKVSVSGSYFFNNSSTNNNQVSNEQYFLSADTTRLYKEISNSQSDNTNHRVNMRIEYKIDSNNTILITPTLSFQKNRAVSSIFGDNSYQIKDVTAIDSISRSINQNNRSTSGYNISNNILYRHAFKKRGRTISLNVTTGLNEREGDNYLEALNQYYSKGPNVNDTLNQYSDQSSNGYQLSANLIYTEPLGKKGSLQVNYNPSYTKSKSDQQTFEFDKSNGKYSQFDSSLSNKFDNDYITQNAGLTYRLGDRDKMLAVGLAYQTSDLNSDQVFPFTTTVRKTFRNFLPNLMLRYKLTAKSNLNIFYRTATNPPSINQLVDVINNTNPLFLSTGNPDLDQQYSQTLAVRYSFTNSAKGKSFFANIFMQQATDYISNATYTASQDSVLTNTVTLFKGSQLSKPVNLDGYWSARSFFTYGMPLKFIKSNLNLNAGVSYVRTPGMINGVASISDSYNYSLGAVIGSNISQYVDFNVSYNANFNVAKNSIQPQLNSNYFSQSAGLQFNILSKNGWFLQNDLNNQNYKGLTDGFNQNYWLWNMGAGKKFLKDKKAELKITAFDLLKQNRSIVRTVDENSIQDVQNQVLQQYFMVTFTYNLRNFGKASARAQRNESSERPENRMMEGRPQQPRNF